VRCAFINARRRATPQPHPLPPYQPHHLLCSEHVASPAGPSLPPLQALRCLPSSSQSSHCLPSAQASWVWHANTLVHLLRPPSFWARNRCYVHWQLLGLRWLWLTVLSKMFHPWALHIAPCAQRRIRGSDSGPLHLAPCAQRRSRSSDPRRRVI
jgi:hypothetical protein